MREIEVKSTATQCQKCVKCINLRPDVCAMYEEYKSQALTPPAIFLMADVILDGEIEPTAERSITPFACTMCGACANACYSMFIHFGWEYPTKLIEGIRELFVEEGAVPEEISEVLRNVYNTKNAWGLPQSQRVDWEKKSEVPIPDFTKEKNEYLLYVGDASLIAETVHIPAVVAKLLHLGGVDFGTLKEKETDSGNEVRELGESGLFEAMADENIEAFEKLGVKKVITISPHDYQAFNTDYPDLGTEFEVYHYTQILEDLIKEGKIKPIKEISQTVTFQDPCHLGRYNKIYETPRNILKEIPGIKLVEMPSNRKEAFCCGGGGGRMWYDEPAKYRKNRISDIRVGHAKEVDAEVIGTACPYCLSMLIAAGNLDGTSVKDIAELVLESLEQ
ncbi:(Fe-S)-binding protein [Thermodesulfobacteriota bacterium]